MITINSKAVAPDSLPNVRNRMRPNNFHVRDDACVYDIRKVSEYFFFPENVFTADLALVFGMNAWHRPLERAVELYQRGLARKLLFTGGYNSKIGGVEAEAMAEGAISRGIPKSDVLVEPCATNTAENAALGAACAEREIGLSKINSVLLVAIQFHMRRVQITAQKLWPQPVQFGWAPYPSMFYSRADWDKSDRGRRNVAAELRKIQTYHGLDLSFLSGVED